MAKRLGWFVALWLAGVAAVGAVGLLIRLWLR
jgi:preprotein translocase subunit Sss1